MSLPMTTTLLLPLLLLLVYSAAVATFVPISNDYIRFELLHRHDPELTGRRLTSENLLERMRELVAIDERRMEGRREKEKVAMVTKVSSGAYAHVGQYFTKLKLGTPPQKVKLVMDTGSDLTWVHCRYRNEGEMALKEYVPKRLFDAFRSSSFKKVPCLSKDCMDMEHRAPGACRKEKSPCYFHYSYLDGAYAEGIQMNETVSVRLSDGEETQMYNMTLGCTTKAEGGEDFNLADGVMGLALGDQSITVRAGMMFGGKFSYCLVYHLSPKNTSNVLTFGSAPLPVPLTYTSLLTAPTGFSYYAIEVMGVSVNGVLLPIPSKVWVPSDHSGTVVDTGSTLTWLVEPAYKVVFPAIRDPLVARFPNLERKIPELKVFEYCFEPGGFTDDMAPKLVFHLQGNTTFEPHVRNYIIDMEDGSRCIGIVKNNWPGISVIGNIMQQNYIWEYDLTRGSLGFAPSTCSSCG